MNHNEFTLHYNAIDKLDFCELIKIPKTYIPTYKLHLLLQADYFGRPFEKMEW